LIGDLPVVAKGRNKRKVHSAFPGPLVEQIGFFQGYVLRIEKFLGKMFALWPNPRAVVAIASFPEEEAKVPRLTPPFRRLIARYSDDWRLWADLDYPQGRCPERRPSFVVSLNSRSHTHA